MVYVIGLICVWGICWWLLRKSQNIKTQEQANKLASYSKNFSDEFDNSEFFDLSTDEKGLVNQVGKVFYYVCLLRCCEHRRLSEETVKLVIKSYFLANGVDLLSRFNPQNANYIDSLQKNLVKAEKMVLDYDELLPALMDMVCFALNISDKEKMLTFKGIELAMKCQKFIATNVMHGIDFILKINNIK